MEPSSVPPVIRPPIRASSPMNPDFEMPRALTSPSDFERQADDIIANFRARQGMPLESAREAIQYLDDTYGKYSSSLRREVPAMSALYTTTLTSTYTHHRPRHSGDNLPQRMAINPTTSMFSRATRRH
ncbi:hypothetical protein Hamer_G016164, partial [Homarus americanus]